MLNENWRIDALDSRHERAGFDCGEPAYNAYLQRLDAQEARRSLTRTFVLTRDGGHEPDRVLGLYSLSATSILRERFPTAQRKSLARYPIAAVSLGRLACDLSVLGQGLEEFLLIDALLRSARAATSIDVDAVLLDTLHERHAATYRAYGFLPLPGQPRTLFLPMETVLQLL